MEDIRKRLAVSIIDFLRTELESERLGEEGSEALEVAVQCLETAYVTDGATTDHDLLAIYQSAVSASSPTTPQQKPTVSQADKDSAEAKKVEGNDFMRDGKFNDAIASYTSAIALDPSNAIYYSNRAAAYAKLQDNKNSILDCEKALNIDPSYSKAYGRMGLAYFNDENYEKAIDAYENALRLDPSNQPYKSQLDSAREKLNAKTAGAQPAPPNPLAGLDLSSLLSNPAVMNMAQSFMTNPQVQNMFTNMMGGAGGPGGPPNQTDDPSQQNGDAPHNPNGATAAPPPNPLGNFGGIDFSSIMDATSRVATQMQQENPDMVNNLRTQFQQGGVPPFQPPAPEAEEKKSEQ